MKASASKVLAAASPRARRPRRATASAGNVARARRPVRADAGIDSTDGRLYNSVSPRDLAPVVELVYTAG